MDLNWFAAATVPIWFASMGFELYRGNIALAIVSLCFAVANGVISTLGGK